MITFTDGPAARQTLDLRRAPLLLRVCFVRGKLVDALDQLTDVPKPHERLVVYRALEKPTALHLHARGKGGKALRGWWGICKYGVLPDTEQPPDAVMRDATAWCKWCQTNGPRLCGALVPPVIAVPTAS